MHPYLPGGRRLNEGLDFLTTFQRFSKCKFISILNIPAPRQTVCQPGNPEANWFGQLGYIAGGMFTVNGRIGSQHNLLNLTRNYIPKQPINVQVFQGTTFKKARSLVQDIILPLIACPLEGYYIAGLLDHANDGSVTMNVSTYPARILVGQVATPGTGAYFLPGFHQGPGQFPDLGRSLP